MKLNVKINHFYIDNNFFEIFKKQFLELLKKSIKFAL
jgi:hypothetical protein